MVDQKGYINNGMYDAVLENPTQAYLEYWYKEDLFFKRNIRQGSNVLDVGCGGARTTVYIASHVGKDGFVTGIDFHPKMVESAKRNTDAFSNVEILLLDVRNIDSLDKEFDYVILPFDFLGLIPQEEQVDVLKMSRGRLVKRGKILATVFSEYAAPWQLETYQSVNNPATLRVDKDFVYADASSYAAERFSKKKVAGLFRKAGLEPEVGTMCKMGYWIVGSV